jgi:cell division protein FtsL
MIANMNNKALLFIIVLLNIVMIFLLVHKQNKIIKALYELQHLHEQKEELLQQKKELMLRDQKGQQLSSIQTFAKESLQMNSLKLKDAHAIPSAEPEQSAQQKIVAPQVMPVQVTPVQVLPVQTHIADKETL